MRIPWRCAWQPGQPRSRRPPGPRSRRRYCCCRRRQGGATASSCRRPPRRGRTAGPCRPRSCARATGPPPGCSEHREPSPQQMSSTISHDAAEECISDSPGLRARCTSACRGLQLGSHLVPFSAVRCPIASPLATCTAATAACSATHESRVAIRRLQHPPQFRPRPAGDRQKRFSACWHLSECCVGQRNPHEMPYRMLPAVVWIGSLVDGINIKAITAFGLTVQRIRTPLPEGSNWTGNVPQQQLD